MSSLRRLKRKYDGGRENSGELSVSRSYKTGKGKARPR